MIKAISFDDACNSILRLLSLCGVASSEQCARLAYSHTKKPLQRVWPCLKHLRKEGYIETLQVGHGTVGIHRLSLSVRKKNEMSAVRWDTLLQHKLAVTDAYIDLCAKQCPQRWMREYRQIVRLSNGSMMSPAPDVFTYINGIPCFLEVQLTAISANRWTLKRQLYELYYHANAWLDVMTQKPVVVVIQNQIQQENTIGTAVGYDLLVTKSISETVCRLDPDLYLSHASYRGLLTTN